MDLKVDNVALDERRKTINSEMALFPSILYVITGLTHSVSIGDAPTKADPPSPTLMISEAPSVSTDGPSAVASAIIINIFRKNPIIHLTNTNKTHPRKPYSQGS